MGVVHSTRLSEVRRGAWAAGEVSHTVLVLLGAAQDQRRALFERSEFARRPRGAPWQHLNRCGVSCSPSATANRIDLSFPDKRKLEFKEI